MAGREIATKKPRKQSATKTIGDFLKKNAAVFGAEELRKSMLRRGGRVAKKPPKRKKSGATFN